MQYSEHVLDHETRCAEAIAILKFHRKQEYNRASRAIGRVNKVAIHAVIIVFTVMSYFLHAALLGDSADIATHAIAFILNSIIALVTYIMIHELHPSRAIGENYWRSSKEYENQITLLEQELSASETTRAYDICQQYRKSPVTVALTTANNLSRN